MPLREGGNPLGRSEDSHAGGNTGDTYDQGLHGSFFLSGRSGFPQMEPVTHGLDPGPEVSR